MGLLPKGSPLDACLARLSVLSYNLLAPLYVRPIDERTGGIQSFAAFEWAEPAAERLDWDVRRPKLRSELLASRADVICLQEVQYEADEDGAFFLPNWREPAFETPIATHEPTSATCVLDCRAPLQCTSTATSCTSRHKASSAPSQAAISACCAARPPLETRCLYARTG